MFEKKKQSAMEQKFSGLPSILGAKVRDTVTGFEGIATGYYIFLTGCNRIGVTPPVDKDGKLPEPAIFDETSLEIVQPAAKLKEETDRGGPPTRQARRGMF